MKQQSINMQAFFRPQIYRIKQITLNFEIKEVPMFIL